MRDVFRWLPLSDRKGLTTPRVIFRDTPNAGGYFYCRTADRCIDEWLDVDRKEADHIVLSTHWGDPSASTIAHEHRHFQQHYRLLLPQIGAVSPCIHDGTYEGWRAGVKRFYRSQPWEMDALLYSMRVHRDEGAEQHFEAVL